MCLGLLLPLLPLPDARLLFLAVFAVVATTAGITDVVLTVVVTAVVFAQVRPTILRREVHSQERLFFHPPGSKKGQGKNK